MNNQSRKKRWLPSSYHIIFNIQLAKQKAVIQKELDEMNSSILSCSKEVIQLGSQLYLPEKMTAEDLPKTKIGIFIQRYEHIFKKTTIGECLILKMRDLVNLRVMRLDIKTKMSKLTSMEMSDEEFTFLITQINVLMVEHLIINGGSFSLPYALGRFKMKVRKNDNLTQRWQNKKETVLNARRLLAEGKSLKTKKNPEGVEYRIYYSVDYFYTIRWARDTEFLINDPNARTYRLAHSNRSELHSRILAQVQSFPETHAIYTKRNGTTNFNQLPIYNSQGGPGLRSTGDRMDCGGS